MLFSTHDFCCIGKLNYFVVSFFLLQQNKTSPGDVDCGFHGMNILVSLNAFPSSCGVRIVTFLFQRCAFHHRAMLITISVGWNFLFRLTQSIGNGLLNWYLWWNWTVLECISTTDCVVPRLCVESMTQPPHMCHQGAFVDYEFRWFGDSTIAVIQTPAVVVWQHYVT